MLATMLISPCDVGRDVVGFHVGLLVRYDDGSSDGFGDGCTDGILVVGCDEGIFEGEAVVGGEDGLSDDCDGTKEGICEGSIDGPADAVI